MRNALLIAAASVIACGDGRPAEWDACPTEKEVRCGSARDGSDTVLVCQSTNSWVKTGTLYDDPCTNDCAESGTNVVSCAGTPYSWTSSACEGDATACAFNAQAAMKCVDGKWAVTRCEGTAKCRAAPSGNAACL